MKTPANMVVLPDADNVGIALRDIVAGDSAVDAQGRSARAVEAMDQYLKTKSIWIALGG